LSLESGRTTRATCEFEKRLSLRRLEPAAAWPTTESRCDHPHHGEIEPSLSLSDVRVPEDLGRRVGMAIDNGALYSEALQAAAVRDRVLTIVPHDLRNQLGVVRMGTPSALAENRRERRPG